MSTLMVETTPGHHVVRNVGDQGLSLWGDPVNDCNLHALGVICPSTSCVTLGLGHSVSKPKGFVRSLHGLSSTCFYAVTD